MKIPRFWANETAVHRAPGGKAYRLSIWRWSDASPAEARVEARQRLDEIARRLAAGQDLDVYGYGERPLREEMVQTVPAGSGDPAAVITRNAYGALVLNAARVLFADLDFAEGDQAEARPGLLGGLFGGQSSSPEQRALDKVEAWTRAHPDWSLRAYRTRAGLRLLATHTVFDPAADATRRWLTELGSDPLYIRLCRDQACFRARLTPKPWRCGLRPPPARYPWETPQAEALVRRWEQTYEATTRRFGVCRLLREFGGRSLHPEAAQVIDLHDRHACLDDRLPLA